jgi:hypothetical protein
VPVERPKESRRRGLHTAAEAQGATNARVLKNVGRGPSFVGRRSLDRFVPMLFDWHCNESVKLSAQRFARLLRHPSAGDLRGCKENLARKTLGRSGEVLSEKETGKEVLTGSDRLVPGLSFPIPQFTPLFLLLFHL